MCASRSKIAAGVATILPDMTPTAPDQPCAEGNGQSIDWPAALARHHRWLWTVVLARVGEPQAVDEVMQEVSMAALAQRWPLRDPEKTAPWLYRLAVTQSLLYRRKQGRGRKLVGRYAQRCPATVEDRGSDPLGWLLADERRQLVRTALERLSRRDAEILLLKYSENWTYKELADHLGISHSAVEARLHRARARLRQQLAALQVIEVET